MPNVYGIASPNPPPVGLTTIGAVDVACSAGVETNVISGAAPLPGQPGMFYPAWFGAIVLTFGATIPTLVTVASRLNNGADLNAMLVHGGFYTSNGSAIVPISFFYPSQVISNPSGTWNFQISVNSTGQALTVRTSQTYVNVQWVRATDQ